MMFHVKLCTNLPNGDRVEHFYWANGGAARIQTRTAFYGPAFGPKAHWSEVSSLTSKYGVAHFFRGLVAMTGAVSLR